MQVQVEMEILINAIKWMILHENLTYLVPDTHGFTQSINALKRGNAKNMCKKYVQALANRFLTFDTFDDNYTRKILVRTSWWFVIHSPTHVPRPRSTIWLYITTPHSKKK